MADDHVLAADVLEHRRRHFAGEGAEPARRRRPARRARCSRTCSSRADFRQVDERRTHDDLDRRLARQAEQQRLRPAGVLGARAVHLPVSGDERRGASQYLNDVRWPPRRARKLSGGARCKGNRAARRPALRRASAAAATDAASSLAISRTSLSSLPSTITRITGSVPEARSTTRPLVAEPALGARHGLLDLRRLSSGSKRLRDLHVDQHLRKLRHRRGQLREAAGRSPS